MAHKLLDIVELVASFFEPVSKGRASSMGSGVFRDACGPDGSGDGPLNTAGMQVMPLDAVIVRVYRQITGREKILPVPGGGCSGIFTGQCRGHGDRDLGVSVVDATDLVEVSVEALEELPVIGQEGHAVAVRFGVADGDEHIFKVQVLNTQT